MSAAENSQELRPSTVEEAAERSQRAFAGHMQRTNVRRVLEIGCRSPRFASDMRRLGFTGTIYSAAADRASYLRLLIDSRDDPRWIPWARSELLGEHPRPPAPTGIEALEIDLADDEAIDPHLPLIADAHLLRLRRPRAACRAQVAGGRRAADARCLAPLGFRGGSFQPSGACGGGGDGGGDGDGDGDESEIEEYREFEIYSRPDVSARTATGRGTARGGRVGSVGVITSMGGTLQRRQPDGTDFGAEWFRDCMDSWRRTEHPVVSVSEIRPPDGSQWVRTDRRPSILQMLAGGAGQAGTHLLLINADILLTDRFFELLPALDPDVVYYANRVDVERDGRGPGSFAEKGVFTLGYDCFLLPSAFVQAVLAERLLPEEYCIGEPWWDYALPLAAVARGFPTKKLPWTHPLALHLVHPTRYSLDVYYRNGQVFLEFCESLLGDRPVNAAGLLGELLADRGDFDASLESVTRFIVEALP